MALPLTGTITSQMILAELGYTNPTDRITCIVIRPGGQLQVMVNGVYINLNMCSPYLPTEVPPFIVPTHWYGYDHQTTGVTNITVTGDTTLDVGQVVTYTATLVGDNLSGVVLRWYKFEAGSWSGVLNTGTSTTITWVDPRNAIVKVVASNICNFSTVTKEVPVTYNCVPVTTGNPYVTGTHEVNTPFDVYAVASGNVIDWDVLGRSFTWEVTGPIDIVGGQGTSRVTVKPTGTTLCNIRVIIVSCGNTYTSGWVSFTPITAPAPTYCNTAQSLAIQKQCPSGQFGSYVTVTRAAGSHCAGSQVDANNLAISWLNGLEAQLVANNDPSGTCGSTPTVPNDTMSQTFQKYCTTGTGTYITYTVSAGTYLAADKGAANALAAADIAANGQTNANTLGSCITGGCLSTISGLSISLDNSTFVSTITGSYTVTVGESGSYSYNLYFSHSYGTYGNVGTVYLNAGSNTIPFSFTEQNNYSITGTLGVGLQSICGSQTANSGTITVTHSTGGGTPNMGYVSVICFIGMSSGSTIVRVNNALGSHSTVYIKWRPYVSNPAFQFPWYAPGNNSIPEGSIIDQGFGTSIPSGTIIEVKLYFDPANESNNEIRQITVTS